MALLFLLNPQFRDLHGTKDLWKTGCGIPHCPGIQHPLDIALCILDLWRNTFPGTEILVAEGIAQRA